METFVEFGVCTVHLATICRVETKREDFKIELSGFSPETTVLEQSSQETTSKLPNAKEMAFSFQKKKTTRNRRKEATV